MRDLNKIASEKALEWCEKNPDWKRICDIEDISKYKKKWEDLSQKEQQEWIDYYSEETAKDHWKECSTDKCLVKTGFINHKGEFYDNIIELIKNPCGFMTVYKVGELNK